MRDCVGVYDVIAMLLEQRGGCALACGDSAGEGYSIFEIAKAFGFCCRVGK